VVGSNQARNAGVVAPVRALRRSRLVAMAVVLVVLVAGCRDGESEDRATATSGQPASSTVTTTTTTTTAAPSEELVLGDDAEWRHVTLRGPGGEDDNYDRLDRCHPDAVPMIGIWG